MVICPGCGSDIGLNEKYCPKCGAPADAASNLDPMTLPESEGRLIGSAVERPTKPIVLICVWLLFAPIFIISAVMLVDSVSGGVGDRSQSFIFLLFSMGGLALSGIILFRVTTNYFRLRRSRQGD